MARLIHAVDIDVPAEFAFDALTDWSSQSHWIPSTKVTVTQGSGHALGDQIGAFSGIGPIGFLDTMTITQWDPPRVVQVLHTGALVRGPGVMRVASLGGGRSRVIVAEDLKTPFGSVGEFGWHLVKPVIRFGLQHALTAFAEHAEQRYASR